MTLDPAALRAAFGSFMTGVTVVTARAPDGTPVGFTANSFSSVSLDPPMLLVCPGKRLSSHEVFAKCTHFAVNILAEGQEDISNTFAGYQGDRFARVAHSVDMQDLPLIDGALAQFCCTTHERVAAGDHMILIGEVERFHHVPGPGLGFVGGRYFSLGLERDSEVDGGSTCGAIVEMEGRVLLEPGPHGHRLPEVSGLPRGAHRDGVSQALAALGVAADLQQVYSAYTRADGETHAIYFLANATAAEARADTVWVPVGDLPGLTYERRAIADMMKRYALEARTRDFSLYLGDAVSGDIHKMTGGG